jgi:hypothetical protein
MRSAFGKDQEIFIPDRTGGRIRPTPLREADYDKLIIATHEKSETHEKDSALNQLLCQGNKLPIWEWALLSYGTFRTIVVGAIVLLPMGIVTIVKMVKGERLYVELWYAVCFVVVATFSWALLDVK